MDPKTGRSRTLRVEIHHEHFAPVLSQRCREIHGGSGLAYTALLVAQGNDPGGSMACEGLGLGEVLHGTHPTPPARGGGVGTLARGCAC